MSKWAWTPGVIAPGAKCAGCDKWLRFSMDAGLVDWCDGKKYHVGCLLDKLAAAYVEMPPDLVGGWGWGASSP